jgi:hypothetical protein
MFYRFILAKGFELHHGDFAVALHVTVDIGLRW